MGLKLILFSLLKKRKKQSSVNQNMLMQIAMLVWIFPGEGITQQGIIGMSIGAIWAVLVHLSERLDEKQDLRQL